MFGLLLGTSLSSTQSNSRFRVTAGGGKFRFSPAKLAGPVRSMVARGVSNRPFRSPPPRKGRDCPIRRSSLLEEALPAPPGVRVSSPPPPRRNRSRVPPQPASTCPRLGLQTGENGVVRREMPVMPAETGPDYAATQGGIVGENDLRNQPLVAVIFDRQHGDLPAESKAFHEPLCRSAERHRGPRPCGLDRMHGHSSTAGR